MEPFIALLSVKLKIEPDAARTALGVILQLLERNTQGDDMARLLSELPEAVALLGQAEDLPADVTGRLTRRSDGLTLQFTGPGGPCGLTPWLPIAAKLDAGQWGQVFLLFRDYIRVKAGRELTGRLFGSLPKLELDHAP